MSTEKKISSFNPNEVANTGNNLFGLPFNCDDAKIVIVPVPWEVTVSYKSGTAQAPKSVFNASFQIDLYDPYIKDAWKSGIAMEDISTFWIKKNDALRTKAKKYIKYLEKGATHKSSDTSAPLSTKMRAILDEINSESKKLNNWVKERALNYLNKNKLVATLGGEHSTPLGLFWALAEKNPSFCILQIDAHADLRNCYEGFEFSHASIMYNALKVPQITKLVQVGIRDFCEAEAEMINKSNGKIVSYFDNNIKKRLFEGNTWENICDDIVEELSELVYISFDIDGLNPSFCPNTGTPVPGGLEFEESLYLIKKIVESGRTIIGFDLSETGFDEWDGNVSARILYRLSNLMVLSNSDA